MNPTRRWGLFSLASIFSSRDILLTIDSTRASEGQHSPFVRCPTCICLPLKCRMGRFAPQRQKFRLAEAHADWVGAAVEAV